MVSMKNLFYFLMACNLVLAGDPYYTTDPEIDYIINSFDYNVSKKNVIYRRDIVLLKNERPAIFLHTSGGGRLGQYWTAYILRKNNKYQRFEDIQFRDDLFRSGNINNYNSKGGIITCYFGKNNDAELVSFDFSGSDVSYRKVKDMDFGNRDDRDLFDMLFKNDNMISSKIVEVKKIKERAKLLEIKREILEKNSILNPTPSISEKTEPSTEPKLQTPVAAAPQPREESASKTTAIPAKKTRGFDFWLMIGAVSLGLGSVLFTLTKKLRKKSTSREK